MLNTYTIQGQDAFLQLMNREGLLVGLAIIDQEDLPILEKIGRRWAMSNATGYVTQSIKVQGKPTTQFLHRLLLNAPAGMRVDHIDHDVLNNRRSNLRLVTASQNNQNQRKASTRSATGVLNVSISSRNRRKPYQVRLQLHGKAIRCGFYETLAEAEKVAIEARRTYFTHAPECFQ